MRAQIHKHSIFTLVVFTTLVSILSTLLLLVIIYNITDTTIRPTEIFIGIFAPLLIASSITYYLFYLLKNLDHLESEMRSLATHDELTGVLTRREFYSKASDYMNIAKRGGKFSILMVDLDLFKQINDSYGHATGDYVLRKFGEAINEEKRATDLIGRYGGEEFVFLLWGDTLPQIRSYTEKLHKKIERMILVHGDNDITITISIGAAGFEGPNGDIELSEIIAQADDALYAAKRTGRNKTVFSDEMQNDTNTVSSVD